MSRLKSHTLIILTSTYPRWRRDSMRNFVETYALHLVPYFKKAIVVAPHYPGARRHEITHKGLTVQRFVYFWPYRYENLGYGEFKPSKRSAVKSVFYSLAEWLKAFRAGVGQRPIILNAHWIIPQGFVALLLRPFLGCKVVVTVHGADIYTLNNTLLRAIKRLVLKRADAVVVNSSATKTACEALLTRSYQVIPMGVDTTLFSKRQPRATRTPLELLFVGRLEEKKGVTYLCKAVKLLRENGTAIHLTVVGEGELRDQLATYIKEAALDEVIKLQGGVPHEHLAKYYRQADVFIGPSVETASGWREAFGLVFAEAAACGLPIIATATGGITDVAQKDVNALIVPQKDAAAIAQAVERLQKDDKLRERLGAAGHRLIKEQFSWQQVAQRYLAVYLRLLEDR